MQAGAVGPELIDSSPIGMQSAGIVQVVFPYPDQFINRRKRLRNRPDYARRTKITLKKTEQGTTQSTWG